MEDFQFELDPVFFNAKPDSQEQRSRNLIFAIIHQAFVDASKNNLRSALGFLNERNPAFAFYCELIDYNPRWLARNLKNAINRSKEICDE